MQVVLGHDQRPPHEARCSDPIHSDPGYSGPAHGGYYTQGMSPRSPWGSRLLFLGVFLFVVLLALAALSIRQEWQQRIGQSRADAIFQLVQGKTPARPIETLGASAWLNLELRRYRERIADPTKARLYGEVAEWQDTRSVPPFFAPLRQLLASPVQVSETPARPSLVSPDPLGDQPAPSSLRTQRFLEL